MARKKYLLIAASALLSVGLCAGVNGCGQGSTDAPATNSNEQSQPVKSPDPVIVEHEVNHDLRWYCFDSTLVIVAKNGNNGVALTHISKSPLCAE